MNTDGTLNIGTAVDMIGFDEGMEHIEAKVAQIGDKAEVESSKITELLNNIPDINLNIVSNASESLAQIQQGFDEIDRVVDTNKAAIRSLETEYANLVKEINEASRRRDSGEVKRLMDERKAIQENIAIRKKVIEEAGKTADALATTEQKLKKEAEEITRNAERHDNLRTKIRDLKLELVEMEAAGQRNTARYREVQEEVGKLTDAWSDATQQANILANDQRGMKGIISGLSGVSGAMSAAQGAVAFFAGENENLQKIMLRVQSLMSITMGLQQLQAAFDKDSAFRLVTLNGLKEWWNKLLAIGKDEMVADTAATVANATAETANAAATETDAVAKEAKATAAGSAASAEVIDTAATTANATAATAGTAANIGLAGAFRMVGAAIKSIPVFGWIAATIGVLIGVISRLTKKAKEAKEAAKEQREMVKDANKAYIEAKTAIDNNINALERFNGTKAQEKKLVSDLNTKYGETMGYHKSRAEWLTILKSKGEAYCQTMLLEAKAQALLNKYTDAYINLMDIKAMAESGEFKKWWRSKSGDEKAAQKAIKEAEDDVKKWEDEYSKLQNEIAQFKDDNELNFHPQSKYDPQKAASDVKKALDSYKESAKKYITDANREITQLTIDSQAEGLGKELFASRVATEQRLKDWEEQLRTLARQRKEMLKTQYMSKEGATETGWEGSSAGKKSINDYMNDILTEGGEIAERYYAVRKQITENGERDIANITQKYNDNLIDEFGTTTQKLEKLEMEWFQRFASNSIPPEFLDEAIKRMEQQFASLKSENFKKLIDWDSVFGELDEQSVQSLRINLDRIKTYFEQNKETMSATEIKDYTEAINRMEDEIASRNPFEAMHKSLKDIAAAKSEIIAAMTDFAAAQGSITEALNEYNSAQELYNQLLTEVDNGTLAEDSEAMVEAKNRLAEAQTRLNQATEKGVKAENNIIKGRNNLTASYRNFATQLKNCGSVLSDVGSKAKNLAAIFSEDVAESIEKGIDFMDEIIDASSSVINALADVGKSAATGIESAVEAAAAGSTAAATAGAAAISTIEKASVILTVISAAIQIATAIANLLNNEEAKNRQIEALQKRIEQLQWELSNQDIVRFNRDYLDVLGLVNAELQNARDYVMQYNEEYLVAQEEAVEAWHMYYTNTNKYATNYLLMMALHKQAAAESVLQAESEKVAVEKLADAWVDVDYNSMRALGEARYENARTKIENLTKQVVLLQEQLEAEQEKKNPDEAAIQEYEQQIQETAYEAANIIKDMMEDIIGSSAADLASQLGDAFIEAAARGEDAMEAWHKRVNEIVADVMKRMMIQKFLEEPIGKLFTQMQSKWFDDEGNFLGIQAVLDSSQDLANGLNQIGSDFQSIWQNLPDDLKGWFGMDEREASQRGIATASQDSVDENNARLTTIQGHTYTLVQGLEDLNGTANEILERVTGIESNTNETNNKLDYMNNRVRSIENTIDDLQRNGIKIWNR